MTKSMFAAAAGITLAGTAGDDTLTGTLDEDILRGLAGNDMLDGGGGNDFLRGDGGADRLYGSLGNDRLDGGAGNDQLDGAQGNDTYVFGSNSGQDRIMDWEGNDRIELGAGITTTDVTLARNLNDDLILSINGSAAKLTVWANFWANHAVETIAFADGTEWDWNDILEHVSATKNDDKVVGTIGDDVLDGLGGNDQLYGDAGNDLLRGGTGNDLLYGEGGNDNLKGGSGDDVLTGAQGNDRLDGGAGNDSLYGGEGNDIYLFGRGSGKDLVSDHSGTDTLQLGAGITTADVTVKQLGGTDLVVSIKGTTDVLTVYYHFGETNYQLDSIKFADGTVWGIEQINALAMLGTDGNEDIYGTAADDLMDGRGGVDSLSGSNGNDTLIGGEGNDWLQGDAGNDSFVFNSALNAALNVDVLVDYQPVNDTIQLDNAIFAQLGANGALNANFFVSSATGDAVDANDYILYENDTGKLFYDADGSGAGAKVQFALLGWDTHPAMTASEFVVI